ncbi:MAG: helix-turn-helix transcriptional regulator [Clostridia bacterium]|nr:helix-turn-helix transcriptional regulator [Clostridia bacterium]
MDSRIFFVLLQLLIIAAAIGFGIYMTVLIVKALRKYTKSEPVRKEKSEHAKSLGEVLKQHRIDCKMTQEFVAESIGVSRQAVSKWESGASDPSTTNLMALAKLFNIRAEDLLKEAL